MTTNPTHDANRCTDDLTEGDRVAVRYDSVYTETGADELTVEGTVTQAGYSSRVVFEADDGVTHDLILDGGLAVELRSHSSGTPRRIGYPTEVTVPEPVETADDANDLQAGELLDVTYNGPQGERTATVEVVDVTDGICDYTDVKALERAENRYVRVSFAGSTGTTVETLRTKTDGRRLGWLESATLVGHVDEPHAAKLDAVSEVEAGDRVALHGDDGTVYGSVVYEPDAAGFTVETDDGLRGSVHATARGVTLRGVELSRREVSVEVVGTDYRHEADAQAAAEFVRGLTEGDRVVVGSETYVVSRDRVRGSAAVDVATPDDYDPDGRGVTGLTLVADALGLTLSETVGETTRLPTRAVLAANGDDGDESGAQSDDGQDGDESDESGAQAVAAARVEQDGRGGYERDEVPPVPAGEVADDPVADALDAYRPDDEDDEPPLMTDGGQDVPERDLLGKHDKRPRTTACVASWSSARPDDLPEFDVFTAVSRAVATTLDRLVPDDEPPLMTDGGRSPPPGEGGSWLSCAECDFRVPLAAAVAPLPHKCPECGGTVEVLTADGGRPRDEQVDGDDLLGDDDGALDAALRGRRHEALQARLDGLQDLRSLAARRKNDALYERATSRCEAIRHELSRRQVERRARDERHGRFEADA